MKRFAGWAVSAGLVLAASAANAQMPGPYRAVSDFDGPYDRPYGAVPPPPPPVYNYGAYGPGGGPGPALLPPQEVYAVLRDNGFSPLGVPDFLKRTSIIRYSGRAVERFGQMIEDFADAEGLTGHARSIAIRRHQA